jgi:hypothetical protein
MRGFLAFGRMGAQPQQVFLQQQSSPQSPPQQQASQQQPVVLVSIAYSGRGGRKR